MHQLGSKMNRHLKAIAAFVGLGVVSACIALDPRSVVHLEPRGDPFQNALHGEYAELALKESDFYDWIDAGHFARKAEQSARGAAVVPEMPAIRGIPPAERTQLEAARERLVATLENTAIRERAPDVAATAQASFDCWVEEQEEGHQPHMIAECKRRWETAMADAETMLQPAVAPAAAPVVESEAPRIDRSDRYQVYFHLDSAEVDTRARRIADWIVTALPSAGERRIAVSGHADRSGADAHNARLAKRRAEAVAALLIAAGVPPDRIETRAYGEKQPAVPTADGIVHPMNRRVVISLL